MATYTNAPWWADIGDDVIVVRGSDGDSICALKRNTGDRLPEEQDANANLLAMAPEMFRSMNQLISLMRKSDAEFADCGVNSEEWDAALEDAEALVDLLSEAGITYEFAIVEEQ